MPIKAQDGRCEEASLFSAGGYIPCNAPAEFIVGWRGRSDTPIRMCAACADHNTRHRGGYVVSNYPASMRTTPRKGDDAVVLVDRPELDCSYIGKTGRVLSVQQGTGDLLLKFRGQRGPVSFPFANVAWRANDNGGE